MHISTEERVRRSKPEGGNVLYVSSGFHNRVTVERNIVTGARRYAPWISTLGVPLEVNENLKGGGRFRLGSQGRVQVP